MCSLLTLHFGHTAMQLSDIVSNKYCTHMNDFLELNYTAQKLCVIYTVTTAIYVSSYHRISLLIQYAQHEIKLLKGSTSG